MNEMRQSGEEDRWDALKEKKDPKVKKKTKNKNHNLQPVARVGREKRTAEHQDAAQNIVLGHPETE